MKQKTRSRILITLMIIGIALMLWGNQIMRHYDGYLEIFKAARHQALPQFIIGLIILCIGYVLTFVKKKQ